jgi:hypothetical protein
LLVQEEEEVEVHSRLSLVVLGAFEEPVIVIAEFGLESEPAIGSTSGMD